MRMSVNSRPLQISASAQKGILLMLNETTMQRESEFIFVGNLLRDVQYDLLHKCEGSYI